METGISVNDRITIAENFLSHFEGHQIFVSKFDPPMVNGVDQEYGLEEVDKKPWHYHGQLDDYYENLLGTNTKDKARGVFFAVNDLDQQLDKTRKRTNKMWTRSRAIWCEDDNVRNPEDSNDFRNDWPLVPNLVVNTSPGKYHYYWLCDIDDSDLWASIQGRMVEEWGSDKSAKDLARVLRLPGFYHLKDPMKPHLVNFICLHKQKYVVEELKSAFPPEDWHIGEGGHLVSNEDPESKRAKIKKAKKERVFMREDHVLDELERLNLVKLQIENGVYDITCPWIYEHTDQEDSGTRYFAPYYNGYDQPNFKCNHAHCEKRTIFDLQEKLKLGEKQTVGKIIKKIESRESGNLKTIQKPTFPNDTLMNWPEPWPLIWENWKRIPRELSQPLLLPTVLSLHAYILNSKYITEWGRRPNLYQLNLAESTANKDTNSKDVLRTMSAIMMEMDIFNSVFSVDLFNSDSNITSDTSFLQVLEKNGGSFYWVNTEATRVFQQINSGGSFNSAVMALADKIIEVVDGHGITSKAKVSGRVAGCTDPNIQIVFYSQPETIERYISEDMIDSGFLGRAIITLDVNEKTRPKMFIRRTEHNKTIDRTLAEFYASRTIGPQIQEVYTAAPDARGMEQLDEWSEKFIGPLLDTQTSHESAMYKMISRIGNTAEQLYAIVLGICREWDLWQDKEPRTSSSPGMSPSFMFPLLEFWSQSKAYVVSEFIGFETDPLAKGIESVLLRILKQEICIEKHYLEIMESRGLIPRSVLMRCMRNQGSIKRKLGLTNESYLARCNLVLDQLINNELLREEELRPTERPNAKTRTLVGRRKTKYIGFL